MANVTDVRVEFRVGTLVGAFIPEKFSCFRIPYQRYRRTVTGFLSVVTFYTKRRVQMSTWMQKSEYAGIESIITGGQMILFSKFVLINNVWVKEEEFNVYLAHPVHPTETDTIYRFDFTLEEA